MRDKGHNFLRVFSIIETVVDSPLPVSYADISEQLGLTKPTAHRLCDLLEAERLIERTVDGKKYIPGSRLRTLSLSVLGSTSLLLERRLVLESISSKIGETCNITVPSGTKMMYLDRVETEWPLRISLPVGSKVPLHCTASGKLYLSQLATRERKRLIEAIPLDRLTPNTITESESLMSELKTTRANSVGIDNQEFCDGMVAVAVPINDAMGRICATLAVHGPVTRLTLELALSHIPALRTAAKQLQSTLHSQPAK